MGRLPSTFANLPIYDRQPYELYGELAISSNQIATEFPSAVFQNTVDKPLEVHRMIPRFLAQNAEGVALPTQPSAELMSMLVKLSIRDIGLDQLMTKAPTRPGALTKGIAEQTWEWADPHYLLRTNGFSVQTQGMAFPAIADLATILVCITFEGFLIVQSPPTGNR